MPLYQRPEGSISGGTRTCYRCGQHDYIASVCRNTFLAPEEQQYLRKVDRAKLTNCQTQVSIATGTGRTGSTTSSPGILFSDFAGPEGIGPFLIIVNYINLNENDQDIEAAWVNNTSFNLVQGDFIEECAIQWSKAVSSLQKVYAADGKRSRILFSGEQGTQRDFCKCLYNPAQVNIDELIEIEAEEFQKRPLSRPAD